MIVGSGLIASALKDRKGCILYAAGVSNSRCTEESEFRRDLDRLTVHLMEPGLFVYFGTVADDDTSYVRHKRLCEAAVKARGNYLICRLPIVAGPTSNPHTLLNYLHSRVARSEGLDIWTHARRNVIDVSDVATAVDWLIDHAQNETVDIAAPQDYSVREIVSALEHATGKRARCAEVDAGRAYKINATRIAEAPIDFSGDYLGSVINRYYA